LAGASRTVVSPLPRSDPDRHPHRLPSDRRRSVGALTAVLSVALLCFVPLTAGVAAAASSSAQARDLAETARAVGHGESLRIEALQLAGEDGLTGMELKRFDVLADGARIVAQTDAGPRVLKPAMPVYLRGSVDGRPGSIAVIGVRASGEIRGVVSTPSGTWLLAGSRRVVGGLRSSKVDPAAVAGARQFACEVRDNPRRAAATTSPTPSAQDAGRALRLPTAYTARIAVELDYEYFVRFGGDADAAALYALDLVAFTGSISESELGMSVLVPFLQVWTTASDPYSGTSGGRLDQLQTWWNSNDPGHCGGVACASIERTTTLYLSSASNGGIAWLPGVCDWYGNPLGSYSYAYAGSIYGDFDIASPDSVWDIVVTSHELGHNFGSPHTHCFSPPVDECYGAEPGCYSGTESLPAGCPGPGQGCATIMSYCHLLTGGIDNVSLTYGAGHPYGTDTNRVPNAMLAELAGQYAATPQCLAPVNGMKQLAIAKTGTGTGVVTTIPSGIDCGTACRTYFDGDQVVQLVAAPGAFSDFGGWSGDSDCADGTVTLSTAVSCTATFDGNCGPAADDCDDNDVCTRDSCVVGDHCLNAESPLSAASCLAPGAARVKITNSDKLGADRLTWQWSRGDAFGQDDLGSPATDTTYTLCIYDSSAATPNLAGKLTIPPSQSMWRTRNPKGWNYNDKSASAGGVNKLQLKTGALGKSKVTLSARGEALVLPAAFSGTEFFDQDPNVVAQLVSSNGKCWTSEFAPLRTSLNTPGGFKASAP